MRSITDINLIVNYYTGVWCCTHLIVSGDCGATKIQYGNFSLEQIIDWNICLRVEDSYSTSPATGIRSEWYSCDLVGYRVNKIFVTSRTCNQFAISKSQTNWLRDSGNLARRGV